MIGKIISVLSVLFAGFMSLATSIQAVDGKIIPIPVTQQIYMIAGEGGNIGIFTGRDGTFLIDDQFAPLTDKIVEAIKSVGGEYPKFLINTHYHGDHTGGNENVRERLRTGSFIEAFNMKRPGVPPEGLPLVTFSEDISFHLNDNSVRAIHVPHVHTDGDSFIYFVGANVIHTGDLFFNGFYPFIDVNHGSSLKGIVIGADKVLSLADDSTKIIPGHGPLGDKEQLSNTVICSVPPIIG
jgi:glyoxylase-like metal-dependent hydrolase (beta-lactamase superfamily II)